MLLLSLKSANELFLSGTFDFLLVIGNFNMGTISWSERSEFASSNESFEGRFFETVDDCFVSQCVEETMFQK